MRRLAIAFVLTFASTFAISSPSHAFSTSGCEGDCNKCHTLTYEDARGIVRKMNSNAKVVGIQISPVKGLWEVSIDDNGRKGLFYTDFSKKFLIGGPFVELDKGPHKSQESVDKLQSHAGGCESDCNKCHTLTYEDALGIIRKINSNAKIVGIQISPVKGLWEVSIDDNGRRGLFYTDFSKKFLIAGPIVELDNGSNISQQSIDKLQNNRKVDVSKIPIGNALVLGNSNAKNRVIVFTDPECPFCAKLHKEMKKVVEQRKDIVFFIKFFPLPMHKEAFWKANSIQCKKSLKMMEDNFEGKSIQKFACATKEIDDNIKMAESLGVTGTPTLILPDGMVHAGTLPADKIIELVDVR